MRRGKKEELEEGAPPEARPRPKMAARGRAGGGGGARGAFGFACRAPAAFPRSHVGAAPGRACALRPPACPAPSHPRGRTGGSGRGLRAPARAPIGRRGGGRAPIGPAASPHGRGPAAICGRGRRARAEPRGCLVRRVSARRQRSLTVANGPRASLPSAGGPRCCLPGKVLPLPSLPQGRRGTKCRFFKER